MNMQKQKRKQFLIFLLIFCSSAVISFSSGISVDAGLTPAENRWIFRAQFRYLSLGSMAQTRQSTKMYMVPVVLAYGLKSNLTLLCRLPIIKRNMSMMGVNMAEGGFGDFFVMGKYKVFRRNTATYILGMAATLGLEIPSGSDGFSSETWDLQPGIYFSWRRGPLGFDVSVAYGWNGFADNGQNGINPGDELALNWAVFYQFSLAKDSKISTTPVLEITYTDVSSDRPINNDIENTGESILYVSPGIKFTRSSLILEALLQIPLSQERKGNQIERNATWLFGLRYMF